MNQEPGLNRVLGSQLHVLAPTSPSGREQLWVYKDAVILFILCGTFERCTLFETLLEIQKLLLREAPMERVPLVKL